MKKTIFIILCFVIGLSFVLVQPTPVLAAGKPIVLKTSIYSSAPPVPYGNAITWYLRRIETATNNRIKFQEYWSATLLPQKTEPEGLKAGIADVAFFQARYQKSRLPLFYITCLPATARDVRASLAAQNELVKMPEIQAEFDKQGMVWLAPGTGVKRGVYTKKKPINSVADFKGMKLRSVSTNILQGFGATTVSISSTEMYEAFQRGVVDGVATSITGGIAWKIPEISKFYWDGDVGMVTMAGWMSKSRWNSLPKDIQEIFRKVGEEEFPLMYDFYLRARGNATGLYDIFPKLGIKVTRPSAKEVDQIQELAKLDWEKHMKTLRKKGLPAQKILDEWLRLNRYYEAYYAVAR